MLQDSLPPSHLIEKVSYDKRYEALNREENFEEYYRTFKQGEPGCIAYWRRYHDLQWQQYESYHDGRLDRVTYEPWLRQRRSNWRGGTDTTAHLCTVIAQLCKANQPMVMLDMIPGGKVYMQGEQLDPIMETCQGVVNLVANLHEIDELAFRNWINLNSSLSEEEHLEYLLEQQQLLAREDEIFSSLDHAIRDLIILLSGDDKLKLHDYLKHLIERQRSYRAGWRHVSLAAECYMRNFVADIRAVMMAEKDTRISQVLDRRDS